MIQADKRGDSSTSIEEETTETFSTDKQRKTRKSTCSEIKNHFLLLCCNRDFPWNWAISNETLNFQAQKPVWVHILHSFIPCIVQFQSTSSFSIILRNRETTICTSPISFYFLLFHIILMTITSSLIKIFRDKTTLFFVYFIHKRTLSRFSRLKILASYSVSFQLWYTCDHHPETFFYSIYLISIKGLNKKKWGSQSIQNSFNMISYGWGWECQN